MGSDMAIAAARDIHYTPAAWRLINTLLAEGTVTMRRVEMVDRLLMAERVMKLDPPEFWDDYLFWHPGYLALEEDGTVITPELARKMIAEGVEILLDNSRECSSLIIGGKDYMVTGGLSAGDPPTECYDPVNMIDYLRLTEKAFTLAEVKRAVHGANMLAMPS